MHPSASTQQLLDELAARERRVLQQLRELSAMRQSPIAPSRPYASLPVTPMRLDTASLHPAPSAPLPQPPPSPSGATGHERHQVEVLSWRQQTNRLHNINPQSRETVGNLERDLQRLQYLLRQSPLTGTKRVTADAGDENVPRATNADRLQLYSPTVYGEGGVAVAREKRTREGRQPNLSASPVTPEVKRDRPEAEAHDASPPSLTALSSYSAMSPGRPDGRSPSLPRRSTVLCMDEEPDDGDVALAYDALKRFSRVATGMVTGAAGDGFREGSAIVFPGRVTAKAAAGVGMSPYREPDDIVRSETCNWQHAASAISHSTSEWRRSPVRWFFLSPAATASTEKVEPQYGVREEGGEVTTLRGPALETWAAQGSAHRVFHEGTHLASAFMENSLPQKEVSSQASGAFLSPSRPGQSFNVDAPQHPAVPSASPPPRFPGLFPSTLTQIRQHPASTAGLTFPTLAVDKERPPAPLIALSPRNSTTPKPALPSRGESYGRNVLGNVQPSCAASALPHSSKRTTSYALRAFYARESRAGSLLTPMWEESVL
ncbi:hypothetical protein JKF63_00573 [Porcisia hertigi]|uniref:Uncharacterized protein n=1 Tax=Porcisia hertigi TaxID=2761500 RepID=A0A836I9T7_9TRYP|nr:hypothetical protein JKF63_00573 [Porcisia hertigi]